MTLILDYVQDVLSGLNVSPINYIDPAAEQKPHWKIRMRVRRYYHVTPPVQVPFAVFVDVPDHFDHSEGKIEWGYLYLHSIHQTRKQAEVEVAYLERSSEDDIKILENQWFDEWELEGKKFWSNQEQAIKRLFFFYFKWFRIIVP